MIDLNFSCQMLLLFPGYLVDTSGYLVVTFGYLIATTGYFSLLLVTSSYFSLRLVPHFSNNFHSNLYSKRLLFQLLA